MVDPKDHRKNQIVRNRIRNRKEAWLIEQTKEQTKARSAKYGAKRQLPAGSPTKGEPANNTTILIIEEDQKIGEARKDQRDSLGD